MQMEINEVLKKSFNLKNNINQNPNSFKDNFDNDIITPNINDSIVNPNLENNSETLKLLNKEYNHINIVENNVENKLLLKLDSNIKIQNNYLTNEYNTFIKCKAISNEIKTTEKLNYDNSPTETPIQNPENNEKTTLDLYLDSIGYNRFQIILILIVSYIFFVDGSEMILINLILSSIQKDWKISTFERSILSSSVFFGFFFGSFFSGYLTNKYGRKNPSLVGVILICIFTSLSTFTQSFLVLFSLRLFVGVGIGFVVPALTSLVTECIPTYYRSFVLNMLWIFYPLGIVYICVISIFYIKEKEFLDWKKICMVNSYSSMLMVILIFFIDESPRYLLLKRNYEEAFDLLNKIGYSKNISLTKEQKDKIILESQLMEESNKNKSNFDVKCFTEKKFLKVSLLLSYLWFIASIISYGLLYILPKIFDNLSKHDKYDSLMQMIYSMCILAPCPLFRGVISEIKSLGRKNSILLGFTGAGIACLGCIFNQSFISVSSGLLKFFINTSLGIVSVYTSEVYPTNVRSVALGFGNSITRLGGILTPFICEMVENLIPKGPFWLFIAGSFTGIIACIALPYETMGMALDKIPEKKEIEKFSEKI